MLNFEKKYKDILENIKEWGFLRVYFRKYFHKDSFSKNKEKNKKYLLKSLTFGFKNFLGKYDYLFFSDSKERRKIENYYVDKYFDDIIERIKGKSLLFELPAPKHFVNSKTKYIVSETWVYLLAKIISVFIKTKKIKEIDAILNKENLKINYKTFFKDFYSKYFVYKFFLKLYKPKAVFVNCYYCRSALIKAAKDLNIKVIEIQHGVIKKHDMYKSYIKIDKSFVPDILLSWGKIDEELLIKDIFPIGSWYINYLKKNLTKETKYQSLKEKYKYLVTVSLQDIDEKINKQFFRLLENLDKNVMFFLVPRTKIPDYKFSENIKVIKDDCYKLLFNSDFHMSLYSSCAIEAPALGKPNILVNINNFAEKYFADLEYTEIINNKDEFTKAINKLKNLKNIDKNYNLILNDYEKRINNFLKENLC